MIRTTRRLSKASAIALGLALLGLSSGSARAAIIYGNIGPVAPGFTFQNVTEDSPSDPVPPPLFGPPSPFSVGLTFPGITGAFSATSTGGANGPAGFTDGKLSFSITRTSGSNFITSIGIAEGGARTLTGSGTAATSLTAGLIIDGIVREANGVSVAIPFSTSASQAFNLVANPGIGTWTLSSTLLFPGQTNITKVDVVIDNILTAISEPNSIASIDKKQFIITVNTNVPEPGTAMLLGLSLCGLVLARARRRS